MFINLKSTSQQGKNTSSSKTQSSSSFASLFIVVSLDLYGLYCSITMQHCPVILYHLPASMSIFPMFYCKFIQTVDFHYFFYCKVFIFFFFASSSIKVLIHYFVVHVNIISSSQYTELFCSPRHLCIKFYIHNEPKNRS